MLRMSTAICRKTPFCLMGVVNVTPDSLVRGGGCFE